MGQAKQRGTFDDRLAQAVEANKRLEKTLNSDENLDMTLKAFAKRRGMQKTRVALMRLGFPV